LEFDRNIDIVEGNEEKNNERYLRERKVVDEIV
jgi:hypothetical protein